MNNRYYHLFHTEAEQTEAYSGSGYTEPWLSCVSAATPVVAYNKPKPGIIITYTYNGEQWELSASGKFYDGGNFIETAETITVSYTANNMEPAVFKNELFSYNGVVCPVNIGETYMGKSVYGYVINGNNLFPISIPENPVTSGAEALMLLPTGNGYSWTTVCLSYIYDENEDELTMRFDDTDGNPIQNPALDATAPTFLLMLADENVVAFGFVRQMLPEYVILA